MTRHTDTPRALGAGDRTALGIFMALGGALAIATVIGAVMRIVEVLGDAVPVPVSFIGTTVPVPVGPAGAPVPAELERAVVVATELPVASVAALVLEQLVLAAAVVTVVGALLWLALTIMRGQLFSRRNTALVATAGVAALFGAAAVPLFATMGANGAVASLSGGTVTTAVFSVEPLPLVLIAFVAALTTTAFSVGDRLQRDTEGLV